MPTIYLPLSVIKRETEKAYQLECPQSSYSYAKARFWVSRQQAQRCRYGSVEYLQLYLPAYGEMELTRYSSKRERPEVFRVSMEYLYSMFALDHDQMLLKFAHQERAMQADVEFEQAMRGY